MISSNSKHQDDLPGDPGCSWCWSDWNLTQSFTTTPSSPFSNVVKRIKNTRSESSKANTDTKNKPYSKQPHT